MRRTEVRDVGLVAGLLEGLGLMLKEGSVAQEPRKKCDGLLHGP